MLALLVAGAACSTSGSDGDAAKPQESGAQAEQAGASNGGSGRADRSSSGSGKRDRSGGGRSGPFEIVLGEWAVTPEAEAVAPGPVIFLISNRGTMTHGFEIEDDEDHSGSGGGDGFKFETELIEPGESVTVRLSLAPGIYKIECLVDGHDDLGMEGFLEVRRGAGKTRPEQHASNNEVAIAGFAFDPPAIEVPAGTEITWTNDDPAEHTVTGDGFDSDTLAAGDRFSHQFSQPGTYRYRCAIHPEMTAQVTVTG